LVNLFHAHPESIVLITLSTMILNYPVLSNIPAACDILNQDLLSADSVLEEHGSAKLTTYR
jgi:hypothetical protein